MAHQNVCRYNKFGYCKFSEKCRMMHISEICTNTSCEIQNCNLRHPKMCKFFREYNRCKFGEWCYFLHTENKNVEKKIIDDLEKDMNDKIEGIRNKIEDIDEKIVALEKHEIEIIQNLESIFERRIVTLENNVLTLRKCLAEKDEIIITFETRLKRLEDKLEDKINVENVNSEVLKESVLKCSVCDFTTTSQHGLKVHVKRKHTEQNFSKTCNLGNKTFKSLSKYRSHKFEHTNWEKKNKTYTCKECGFVGRNMHTHEVHMGKAHSDNFECGLCDNDFGNFENLEIHLNTCEIYQCRSCSHKENNVSDIKRHAKTEHGMPSIIDHLKICRENMEEISETMYWDSQL